MKAYYLVLVLLLVAFKVTLHAQTPNWQWADGATGISTASVVCSDANSNVYAAGSFLGVLVLGNSDVIDNMGPYQNVFVVKYDALGNDLWAQSGSGYADVFGVISDAHQNVYVTGDFYSDSITFGNNVLLDPDPGDQKSNGFLVKYDSSGNVIWAKNLGGINNDQALGVSVDANDNVYVTGNFTGDSLTMGSITLQHLGNFDCFVAKFNSFGDAVWIRSIGSPFSNGSSGICTDMDGNVFITGFFLGNYLYLGNTNTYITSPFDNNTFVTRYDSNGSMQWTKYAGGNSPNSSVGISADTLGGIYITGTYSGAMVFENDTLIGIGFQNIFTAKFDSSGSVVWAKSSGGRNADQSTGISTDGKGNSYVTGFFQSDTVFFDTHQLLNFYGTQVAFVVKYDAQGNVGWVLDPSGQSNNVGAGICYSYSGIYLTGTFTNTSISFGADVLSIDALYPSQNNFFLAKINPPVSTGLMPVVTLPGKITVYPNPSNSNFYFAGVTSGDAIELYDLQGQNVYSAMADKDQYFIDLSKQPGGIYFYRIANKNGISESSGKIIKQ